MSKMCPSFLMSNEDGDVLVITAEDIGVAARIASRVKVAKIKNQEITAGQEGWREVAGANEWSSCDSRPWRKGIK